MAALAEVEAALQSAGSNKSRILDVTIWLADIERDYAAMNVVYDAWVLDGALELTQPPAPSRACVQAKLFSPGHLIEVKVVAATRR